METFTNILASMFRVDSIWSVVTRAIIWFAITIVVIISMDHSDSEQSMKSLKSNLGFLVMFLILSGSLIYLLFGYQTT